MTSVPANIMSVGAWLPVEPRMRTEGVVQQCLDAGYVAYPTPSGRRVWFTQDNKPSIPPLIAFSPWIVQSASELLPFMERAGEPPNPTPAIDLQDITATGALRQVLRNGTPVEVIQRWQNEFVGRNNTVVVRLLDTLFLPELLRRWPGSAVCFVGPTSRTHAVMSMVRTQALREILSWQGVREIPRDTGFPILRALHTMIGATAGTYLNVIAALAFPFYRIWIVPRIPGDLIIILNGEQRISLNASNEREIVRDPIVSCYMTPVSPVRFHQPAHSADLISTKEYFIEAIEKTNDLMEAVFAVHHRTNERRKADFVSTLKIAFVVERIAQSVLSIASSYAQFNRVHDSFAMLDLLAGLASSRLKAKIAALPRKIGAANKAVKMQRNRLLRGCEPLLTDTLLSDRGFGAYIKPALRAWKCRACLSASREAHQRFRGLHNEARRSLFAGKTGCGDMVKIRFREVEDGNRQRYRWRTRTLKGASLAGQVVRQLRNTHHGYDLYDQLFEGLLALSDGGIGDYLPSYLEYVWLAMLGKPLSWVDGMLADVVPLPRRLG